MLCSRLWPWACSRKFFERREDQSRLKMLPIDFGSIDALVKKPDAVIEEMERRSSISTDESRKADHLAVLVHGYVKLLVWICIGLSRTRPLSWEL